MGQAGVRGPDTEPGCTGSGPASYKTRTITSINNLQLELKVWRVCKIELEQKERGDNGILITQFPKVL